MSLEERLLLWLWTRALKRGALRLPVGPVQVVAGPEEIVVTRCSR